MYLYRAEYHGGYVFAFRPRHCSASPGAWQLRPKRVGGRWRCAARSNAPLPWRSHTAQALKVKGRAVDAVNVWLCT